MPSSASLATTTGSLSTSATFALSLPTTAGGMPRGPTRPCQAYTPAFASDSSFRLGTSGSCSSRSSDVTASGTSLPLLKYGSDTAGARMASGICPPARSWSAGISPLYGTCSALMPASFCSISIAR
ncbi:hypothetical protein D3C72_1833870 [compost metagenome]